jgi:hypothetical protein
MNDDSITLEQAYMAMLRMVMSIRT